MIKNYCKWINCVSLPMEVLFKHLTLTWMYNKQPRYTRCDPNVSELKLYNFDDAAGEVAFKLAFLYRNTPIKAKFSLLWRPLFEFLQSYLQFVESCVPKDKICGLSYFGPFLTIFFKKLPQNIQKSWLQKSDVEKMKVLSTLLITCQNFLHLSEVRVDLARLRKVLIFHTNSDIDL